jgi:small-conductance mechanosensitive channel
MEVKYRIVYTAIVLVVLFLDLHKARLAIITKLTNVLLYVTTIVFIAFVWGVEERQLLIYISSFLTLLGIAFFAQWSILSNITAGLILFINYPVKIGSTIRYWYLFYHPKNRKKRLYYLTQFYNFTKNGSV